MLLRAGAAIFIIREAVRSGNPVPADRGASREGIDGGVGVEMDEGVGVEMDGVIGAEQFFVEFYEYE
jgi:hypothetical protein